MAGYEIIPGVDSNFRFPPEVLEALRTSPELAYFLDRANHGGSQLASTISDFAAAVGLVPATTAVAGSVKLATAAQAQAMTQADVVITPQTLASAAVSAATANRVVRRDSNGRAAFQDGLNLTDAATIQQLNLRAVSRGTTAERNSRHGSPSTTAAQVALANLKPTWFNTDYGVMESYYAPTGASGLSVPGLVSGTAAGWYPVGFGPTILLEPSAALAVGVNSGIGGWNTTRNDSTDFYTSDGTTITFAKAGWYHCSMQTMITNADVRPDIAMRLLNSANTKLLEVAGGHIGITSLYSVFQVEMRVRVAATNKINCLLNSGPTTVHQGDATRVRGQFLIDYLGPAL